MDGIRAQLDVHSGETQKPKPGVQESVLPPIVFDQPIPMIRSVVFDHEARARVVEIGPSNEPAICIVELRLDFRARQAGLQQ